MKKIIKLALCATLASVILCLSCIGAFAAETTTVNGKPAKQGDKVSYDFFISDAKQKVCGIQMYLFYDTDVLKLTGVDLPDELAGSTVNDDINKNGTIIIVNSFVNGVEGLECVDKTLIATAEFEVIGEGDTEITYYVPFLYDIDMVNFYVYSFSCDLKISGNVVAADEKPALATDAAKFDGLNKGDFANSVEGTGSGIKPTQAPVTAAVNTAPSSVKKTASSDGTNWTVVGVCIVVIGIIGLVILKIANDKAKLKRK